MSVLRLSPWSRPWARACLIGVAALAIVSCKRRPDFDLDKAHQQLARAFDRDTLAVQILGDGRGSEPETWIVDFKLDGFEPFLEAKFVGREHEWVMEAVRERSNGPQPNEWMPVGTMLGQFRGATIKMAHDTETIIRELAELIERYSVEHGNRFPETSLDGIGKLVQTSGYIEASKWHHESDAWGNALAYHAGLGGTAYIIVSPGADGKYDTSLDTYFSNTDQGIEIYGGVSSDPNKDFVFVTGSFGQRYAD